MDIKQLQKQIRLKRNQITKLTHVLEHEKDSESAKELQDKLNNLYEE